MYKPLREQSLQEINERIKELDKIPEVEKLKSTRYRKWILGIFWILLLMVIGFYFFIWFNFKVGGADGNYYFNLGDWHNWGDAFGGLAAPFIGLLSAILVYLSFQEQIKANKLVTDVRKEDNILENLRNYLSRVESKYDSIEAKLIAKSKGMGDGNNHPYTSVINFLRTCNNDLKVLDPLYQNIEERAEEFIQNRLKQLDSLRLTSTDIFIKEILILVKFCNFYADYLYKWFMDPSLTPETKEAVELYISEFLSFLDARFDDEIFLIGNITIHNFPINKGKERISHLIYESGILMKCYKELTVVVRKNRTQSIILYNMELKEIKAFLKSVQESRIRGVYDRGSEFQNRNKDL